MQQYIELGQNGLNALQVLNDNFTELYSAIPTSTKLPGEQANFQVVFPANTMIRQMSMVGIVGTPTVRVGITPNGQELVPDTVIDDSTDFTLQFYCKVQTTLYFTFVLGPGAINVRVDVINNYY